MKGALIDLMNQDTQELFHNFTAVIRELAVLAGDIATVEERKAEAAVQKRHQLFDGFIQKEQSQSPECEP